MTNGLHVIPKRRARDLGVRGDVAFDARRTSAGDPSVAMKPLLRDDSGNARDDEASRGGASRYDSPADMRKREKVTRIQQVLDELYPAPPIPLLHDDAFTLL